MIKRHITEILDRAGFDNLSEMELHEIGEHAAVCEECRRAFRAAAVVSRMLRIQSAQAPVPSPFFQAKVLNARLEKQNPPKPAAAFRRWWQATAAPVSIMVLTVVGLIGVSVFAPVSGADEWQARQSNDFLYLDTTEAVILNQKPSSDLTTEQVFRVLDATRSGAVKTNGQRK